MGYTTRRSTILTAIVSGIWSDIYHRIRSGRLLLLYWVAASVAHVLNSARFALYELRRSGKRSGFIQTLAARLLSLHFLRSRFIILLNTALRSCFVCQPAAGATAPLCPDSVTAAAGVAAWGGWRGDGHNFFSREFSGTHLF